MDDVIYDIEERQKCRKERIEKMRQEKERQRKRREMIKKWFPAGALAVVLIVGIVTVSLIPWGKKTEEKQTVANGFVAKDSKPFKNQEAAGNQKKEKSDASGVTKEDNMGNCNSILEDEDEKRETSGKVQEEVEEKKAFGFQSNAKTVTIVNEEVISPHAILIDESTDTIVASKGSKERISPASMTKVLTILVAAEHITKEQLDDTFIMTQEITDYGYVNDCSAVGFLAGEKVSVRDMFYGTILPSGVDAAVGLATYVAGSHEAFVVMMNEKLEELGLAQTSHYTNCVGIYDEEHYSTVYDMAVIMKAALQNEFCKEVLSEHNYNTVPTEEHPEGLNISNWFLRRIEDKDTGGEVLCAKTGYVRQSKNCAVSYGRFADGKPYICVTAGSSSSWRCIYDHVEIYNEYI